METIVKLEVYDFEHDAGTWEQSVKMLSDELYGNRVRLEISEQAIGIEPPYTLIFMADDLLKAIKKCRND